jgi:hypothetical protein
MNYPVRTTFYAMTDTENEYGEVVSVRSTPFTIGSRPKTMQFKDALQTNLALDVDRQYVTVRKTPKTSNIQTGDEVTMLGVSSRAYTVSAIDLKFANRGELLFLINSMEEK